MGEDFYATLELGAIAVDVVLKDVQNLHLSVYPPAGRVRIAAPRRMDLETIRLYAISKLGWIRRERKKVLEQERETPREYLRRESHYLWGRRYLLELEEGTSGVEVRHRRLVVRLAAEAGIERRREVLEAFYRAQVRAAVPGFLKKWEPILGVRAGAVTVRRMKTKWGSCSHLSGSIRLNTDLAKKPRECLEYILVHELMHLLEPTHNWRFEALMDRALPNWKESRVMLNRLPVRHEEWRY